MIVHLPSGRAVTGTLGAVPPFPGPGVEPPKKPWYKTGRGWVKAALAPITIPTRIMLSPITYPIKGARALYRRRADIAQKIQTGRELFEAGQRAVKRAESFLDPMRDVEQAMREAEAWKKKKQQIKELQQYFSPTRKRGKKKGKSSRVKPPTTPPAAPSPSEDPMREVTSILKKMEQRSTDPGELFAPPPQPPPSVPGKTRLPEY